MAAGQLKMFYLFKYKRPWLLVKIVEIFYLILKALTVGQTWPLNFVKLIFIFIYLFYQKIKFILFKYSS